MRIATLLDVMVEALSQQAEHARRSKCDKRVPPLRSCCESCSRSTSGKRVSPVAGLILILAGLASAFSMHRSGQSNRIWRIFVEAPRILVGSAITKRAFASRIAPRLTCGSCKQVNEADARFCKRCGAGSKWAWNDGKSRERGGSVFRRSRRTAHAARRRIYDPG